jgi:hypothetical protein
MTDGPQINAFSFCLKSRPDDPSIEITNEGVFKVNGRVVTRDAQIYLSMVEFLQAGIDEKIGQKWNVVVEVGHPEEDESVWYYFEETGVNYGRYVGDHTYAGRRGFLYNDVSHWMVAPEAPLRFMPEEAD